MKLGNTHIKAGTIVRSASQYPASHGSSKIKNA